ncbi:MAG: ATP-binding protein [Gallionella sp.]|nr:ATP-binding protein [Gallionella sp.]
MNENFSTSNTQKHSDGNPFLVKIEDCLATDDIETRLARWPLDGIDVGKLSDQERLDLLDRMQDEMFEPNTKSSDIASRLYRLIRRGYLARDPRRPSVRRATMALAGFSGREIASLPWLTTYAKGMRISGITGVGKSYEVVRALEALPQRIDHGRCDAAGWTHMTQAVWLYVAMSHDGSLGGLLLQILCSLDAAIGTGYSQDRSLTRLSNEKLAVHIGIIFRNHGVGVLVIDEIQHRNFSGARGTLAVTFFLRLLNFGIPIVLIGNPYGMAKLDSFSQDMRRIGSGGSFEMYPMAADDFDWQKCLAPALWRYNVMPEPSPIEDFDGSILFRYSGGIRDYACRIRVASQRLAIDLGEKAVTEVHMEQVFHGPDFSEGDRNLICGFRDRNSLLLMGFTDVPWEQYATKWGYLVTKNSTASDLPATSPSQGGKSKPVEDGILVGSQKKQTPRKPVAVQAHENIKRNRTRKVNDAKRQADIRSTLEPGDIRHSGLQEFLVTGFDALLTAPRKPTK